MKVLFMTGSHPRHLYTARRLFDAGKLGGLIVEQRGQFLPAPPQNLSDLDRENFIRHFKDRETAEINQFSEIDLSYFEDQIPILYVSPIELNQDSTKRWLVDHSFDMAISYGIHKLQDDVLGLLPEYAWNIHGGLSPWFRGTVTLFWPFYFLKPNWTGMTIHHLSSRLDAGNIIHHSVPVLERGDGIHDVACKAVKQAAEDLLKIIRLIEAGQLIQPVPQRTSGKLFVNADWTPQHLRLVYNQFNNDIVDRYLDGEFGSSEPPLIRAF